MKKYLATGLAIILPAFLTLFIVGFLVNILTKPFLGIAIQLLGHVHYFNNELAIIILSKILILAFLFGLTLLIGIIGQKFFVHYFFKLIDYLVGKIPVIKTVYKSAKEVVHSIFSSEKPSFSKVVLVPFPHSQALSIGLISKDSEANMLNQEGFISVLLPGTPNPMMGFMLLYPKDEVIYTSLSVDQAMKMVVSCGIILNKNDAKNGNNK